MLACNSWIRELFMTISIFRTYNSSLILWKLCAFHHNSILLSFFLLGGNASTTRTTTDSEGDKSGAFSSGYKSTVGGVTGIILLCLIAAVLLLWWRARNRQTNRNNADPNRNVIILTNSVACTSYTSVPQSSPADNSTEDSEIFINQPQCVDTW